MAGINLLKKIFNWYKYLTKIQMPFPSSLYFKDSAKLFSVLEDDAYKWRTEEAVLRETKFTLGHLRDLVAEVNERSGYVLMKINEEGERLYTTKRHLIIKALENSEYDWRTFKGIVTETKLEEDLIKKYIEDLEEHGEVVSTVNPNNKDEVLYT